MEIFMAKKLKIDPWGASNLEQEDYARLIKEFGIEEFTESLRQKMLKNRFIRRKIIFGHRDLNLVGKAMESGQPWAVMSGIRDLDHRLRNR
jgi:tryptophanyl-tRNA synthetase